MTVTRCAVELDDGTLGHAYVGGRDRRHAELAAVFDALLQEPKRAEVLRAGAGRAAGRGQAARRQAAAGPCRRLARRVLHDGTGGGLMGVGPGFADPVLDASACSAPCSTRWRILAASLDAARSRSAAGAARHCERRACVSRCSTSRRPLWLDRAARHAPGPSTICAFTAASRSSSAPAAARFALIADAPTHAAARPSTPAPTSSPDRSATLIVQVSGLSSGDAGVG